MRNINPKEQSTLKNELKLLKESQSEEAFKIVNDIAKFLKEKKLSIGYTKGTTSSLLHNYKIGLSNINPLEFDLIAERNFTPKPFWGILLDKNSYQKTNAYLKLKKNSKSILTKNNIEISYDKRLDKIKNHKRYSFKELSKMAINNDSFYSIYPIKDFNNYIDIYVLNSVVGLRDYWFHELTCNSYNSLAERNSFLRTENSFNLILFQEEWMSIIKKLTDLSFYEINVFRKEVGRNKYSKKLKELLLNTLNKKNKLSTQDTKQIIDTLMKCMYYLHCKAHLVSDAYIDLLSKK